MKPRLSITANPRTLVEDEGTETRIRLRSNRRIPAGGLEVTIDSDKVRALGDFDINSSNINRGVRGGQVISGESDNSGFTVRMNRRTTTIDISVFDDNDARPGSPNFNANSDRGRERTTFRIANSSDYNINNSRRQVRFTFLDSRPNRLASADVVDERIEVRDISGVQGTEAITVAASNIVEKDLLTVEDIGLISLDSKQTTGSSSSLEQSSVETGLDTDVLAIAATSDFTSNDFSVVEDI